MKQMYYSEILEKYFDSEEECVKAEKAHEEAEAKKAEAKALVAKESADVNEAFKARNAARHAYNEALVAARKVYNEALRTAEKEFNDSLKEADAKRDEAEKVYAEKLSAFQKAHPEGYRLTLKDGDNVVTYTSVGEHIKTINQEFDDILNMFSDLLRRW